jgi:hypothetical protein
VGGGEGAAGSAACAWPIIVNPQKSSARAAVRIRLPSLSVGKAALWRGILKATLSLAKALLRATVGCGRCCFVQSLAGRGP